ncbi:c-type cytochrome domain-containing protein [Spirosoma areae]
MEHVIQFLGRLHPLIVHLPIGFLLMTLAIHGLVWKKPDVSFRGLLPWLWLASCVSAVIACVAGYLLSLSGGYPDQALNLHMYSGIGLALFSAVIFGMLQWKALQRLQIPIAGLVLFLLIVTGHLGGNLTHGEEYLTEPLVALLGKAPTPPVRRPITDVAQAVVYVDLIEPVLEKKCWQCHSGQKQKGGLRLDTEDLVRKGGKHGPILVAGDALKSDLYQRLLLPEDDDKRMPPKGKTQLSEQEIELIQYWISTGKADFKKRVADMPKDEHAKSLFAAYGLAGVSDGESQSTTSEFPATKVVRASQVDQQKAESQGIVITPVTADQAFLSIDMVNTPAFGDAQMNLLLPMREQIVWLDLSATRITDNALAQLGQFKNLTRLSIDNTRITDAGLAQLTKVPTLRHLNLYATQVTDRGLKSLEACKQLKTVYLWQTKVTPNGVASLRKAVGKEADINLGMNETNQTSL